MFSKEWMKAAGIRAVKTVAQTAVWTYVNTLDKKS